MVIADPVPSPNHQLQMPQGIKSLTLSQQSVDVTNYTGTSPRMAPRRRDTNEKQKRSASSLGEGKVQRLVDLANSDFEMATNDKDYKLNHEQLIKVCKILLHISNNTNTKLNNSRHTIQEDMAQMFKQKDESVRSQMEEVSQLVHTVH